MRITFCKQPANPISPISNIDTWKKEQIFAINDATCSFCKKKIGFADNVAIIGCMQDKQHYQWDKTGVCLNGNPESSFRKLTNDKQLKNRI